MSGIHKASVFGDFKALWVCFISFNSTPFVWSSPNGGHGDVASVPAGDFILCLMTLRQSVWGKGHFRELRGRAILYSEISETAL